MSGAVWPQGFRGAGVHCGIKPSGRSDLGLLVAEAPVVWAGTFTRNAAAAAPVLWCRDRRGMPARAVIVTSGNANACTGPAGAEAVVTTARAAARHLGCEPEEVLVASTGPIGVPLPVEAVVAGIPAAQGVLTEDVEGFAGAILTTDTYVKVAEERFGGARIVGVAKGAAMLAPNMATMLAFIATDGAMEGDQLHDALAGAVDTSFNSISIDACESTNDSVFAFASGLRDIDGHDFAAALDRVCKSLAEQIARDAEGGTKLLRIVVEGAQDHEHAREIGRAVAASALWRAAVHGADPNWGRILAALGTYDRGLDVGAVEIALGDEIVFHKGEPTGSRVAAAAAMQADEVLVRCRVGTGDGGAEIMSADLSPAYVVENAYGTS